MLKIFFQKFKKEIIIFIFIFLITTISFGIGYVFSLKTNQKVPIVFEKLYP